MTIAETILTDMPSVTYDQARDLIRNGDIALFAGGEGMSLAIEHFTQSPFSHVGFIWRMDNIDRVMLLESIEVAGVRLVPLSTKINGGSAGKPYPGKMVVARHAGFPAPGPDFDRLFGEMTRFAVDRLGCPYGADDMARIVFKIAAGMAHVNLPGHLKPDNAYICSEYADICYRSIGIAIEWNKEGFIAPADFARDPQVSAVVTVHPG